MDVLLLTPNRPTTNSHDVKRSDMLSRLCWTCFVIEWYYAFHPHPVAVMRADTSAVTACPSFICRGAELR